MAFQPPEILTTARLHLRRPRAEDALAIFEEYAQDHDVTRHLTWRPSEQLSDTQAFMAGALQRWEAATEFCRVIVLPSDDRPIGAISCRMKEWRVEMGFVLAKRFWNQGLMSEAATAAADWAIAADGIFRVWACCDISNLQSARVLEKAGMRQEGILRRW